MPFRYRTGFESLKRRLRLESLPKRTGRAKHSGQYKQIARRLWHSGPPGGVLGEPGGAIDVVPMPATTRCASSWAAKVGSVDRRASARLGNPGKSRRPEAGAGRRWTRSYRRNRWVRCLAHPEGVRSGTEAEFLRRWRVRLLHLRGEHRMPVRSGGAFACVSFGEPWPGRAWAWASVRRIRRASVWHIVWHGAWPRLCAAPHACGRVRGGTLQTIVHSP